MSSDDQPTIPTSPPNGSRPAQLGWQAPSVEQMQAMLPQYDILDVLGRGGMGAVYKGRQKSLKRLVAIKILPLGAADDEMKFAERFQNEAQTMAAMNHPAIVSVHDFGETKDGLLYFIMEFVDGTDVQKMIQASGKLSGEYALAITAHVCDALDYAHKRGVIHRDIKPANILINQEGHVKVADFGLAKMDDPSQTSGLTKTNMAMGTPDYVAPEVLTTGMVADHRADIYAVGVMLYQMLTGEVPRGMFKLPSHKGLGTDPRFDRIICKAMEQDREERYQSAMDVRRALDVILTTPQAKDDGSGIVSASQIPQKPVAKGPRPPGEKSAGAPARTAPPARQQAQPQRGANEQAVRGSAPQKKSSAASRWLSIGGIVTVLGVAAFFVLGSKPMPDPVDASASTEPAKPQPPIKVRENPPPPPPSAAAATLPLDQWVLLPDLAKLGMKGVESKDGWQVITDRFDMLKAVGLAGETPSCRNLAFRATLRPSKTNVALAFELRHQVDGAVYHLEFARPNRLVLRKTTKDSAGKNVVTTLDDEKLLPQPKADGIYQVEWSIQGDLITVVVDGYKALEFRDQTITGAGRFFFAGQRAALDAAFKDAAIKVLPDAPAMSPSKSEELPKITNWKDVTEKAREQARSTKGLSVESNGAILRTSGGTPPGLTITPPGQRDYAVRLRYTGEAQVNLRSKNDGFLFVLCQGNQTIFKRLRPGEKKSDDIGASKPHPPGFDPTREHELLVTMNGSFLSAWMDGVFIGEAHDDTLTDGAAALMFVPKMVVKKVEIAELMQPKITNWQDVTTAMREQARALPQLVVKENAIHHVGTGATVRVPLTPVNWRDYAVRLRHAGDAQLDLRLNDGGFLYVLLLHDKIVFHRQASGNSEPVKIIPNLPTQPGFDINKQHELLVTIQGPRLCVWLDGAQVCDAQDATFLDGRAAIMFKLKTVLLAAEIAELH